MSKDLLQYSHALPMGSINTYISWVNKIPLLTLEQEQEYAKNLQNNNDLEAARKLVLSHLRLVVSIARGYNGYGLSQADLIQEGNVGLMKAVKRFDPSVGVRLVSFAIHWIRAEIHEFIIRNWRIVKIATTKAQRKLFFNLRKAAKARGWFSDSEVKTIADQLNVSHKDVRQMEQRLNNYDQSFDAAIDDDDSPDYWGAPSNYLEDHSQNVESNVADKDLTDNQNAQLYQAMGQLDARSQDILKLRWLDDKKQTLHTLAAKYNVSAERIRQLEQNAMKKLRELIEVK
ncbi:MAG: RNA polymerase sigma factor RpoH [Gammaproteobacteria bacterium]|nr:RNA polymerase sigma factor RpoH [Gammaproteobacteria bacterium]